MSTMRPLRHFRTFACLAVLGASAAHAQVAIAPTLAQPTTTNAMLEVISPTKGLLVPRMNNAERAAIATPPQGLIVYQSSSLSPLTEPVGYWYFDGTWQFVSSGRSWNLGGNAGTNPAVDFIGTTNGALAIRTNGLERMRVLSSGEWLIHNRGNAAVPAASEKLHVEGGIRIANTAADNVGTIRFNSTGAVSATNPGRFEGRVNNTAPVASGWVQLDNTMSSRYSQPYPLVVGGCDAPNSVTVVGALPGTTNLRPWPVIGSVGANVFLSGMTETPYTYIWEDSRHQYLYRSDSLQAEGICDQIKAIAFEVTSPGGARLHWFRVSLLNTTANMLNADFIPGATLVHTSGIPNNGANGINDPGHATGFLTVSGWNIHEFGSFISNGVGLADDLPSTGDGLPHATGYTWGGPGYNLVVEASVDNQTWSSGNSTVRGFNTNYNSMVGMFCDACGSNSGGLGSCGFNVGAGAFDAPNRHPAGSQLYQQPPPTAVDGWGWKGGGYLVNGTNTVTCDGSYQWNPGSSFTTAQRLPRIAFRANYTGGGVATGRADYIASQQGVMIGDATWAQGTDGAAPHHKFKGPGTISAQKSVWGGAVLLSDHVFDMYYDGMARPEDAAQAQGYRRAPIREMANFVEANRHLPTIEGRQAWNDQGPFSSDQLTTQLWVTVEEQSLYIKELHERMEALQRYLVEKRLRELQMKPIQD